MKQNNLLDTHTHLHLNDEREGERERTERKKHGESNVLSCDDDVDDDCV